MRPAEGVHGRNPNPRPNLFVYPHEKVLLGYDDFHAMPAPIHVEDDENGLLGCIFSQHRLATEESSGEHGEAAEDTNRVTEGKRDEKKRGQMTRKRPSGKNDRHSKIRTAQGLRDRRIRLSVHVSRKFFDLQDILGFDKASNTIEWLIAKSSGAIKGLSLRKGVASSKGGPETRKCDFSSIKQCSPVDDKAFAEIQKGKSRAENSSGDTKRGMRERARVRAMERAREKTIAKISRSSIHDGSNDCTHFRASDSHGYFGSIEVNEKFLGITSAYESSLHAYPTGSYPSENENHSGDDRFQDAHPGSGTTSRLGVYHHSGSGTTSRLGGYHQRDFISFPNLHW